MIIESFTNLSLLANLKITPPRQSIGLLTRNIRMRIPNQALYVLETPCNTKAPPPITTKTKYINPQTRAMNKNGLENKTWLAGSLLVLEIMEVAEEFVESVPVVRVES
jgi:hypothetical protein